MDHRGRLQRLHERISEQRLDVLLVTHLPNIRYLCSFTGSAGVLLVTASEKILFTDGRYTQQARNEANAVKVKIVKKSALLGASESLSKRKNLRRVGIEAAHITVAERATLSKALGRNFTLVSAPPLIEAQRMIKDAEEIARIRDACQLGVKLFDTIIANLKAGVPESLVAGELEFAARKSGVEQMSFPTIIASGERSALPHGRASVAPIPARGFVVCDFGVILAGYCSDMTRTVHMGNPTTDAQATYEAVREAQQAALETIKPGATVGEVDHAARKLLYNRKLGKFFTHSTGHGVGLEIHEAPRIAAAQNEVLQPGMVITIEPGVYLPGRWGVRIEDSVVVTEAGCDILTACAKDLLTI
jgi:Xaa-Pro aminopeptidase